MTQEEAKAKVAEENRQLKIDLIIKAVKKGDEQSWLTVKFLKMKLTQKEWDEILKAKKLNEAQIKKCIDEYDMLKKSATRTYVPKSGEPRKNRFDGTVVEALGKSIETRINDFLAENEQDFAKLEEAGFAFQPFWRNLNNAGKKKTANTE